MKERKKLHNSIKLYFTAINKLSIKKHLYKDLCIRKELWHTKKTKTKITCYLQTCTLYTMAKEMPYLSNLKNEPNGLLNEGHQRKLDLSNIHIRRLQKTNTKYTIALGT